jgi:hypothetical protein
MVTPRHARAHTREHCCVYLAGVDSCHPSALLRFSPDSTLPKEKGPCTRSVNSLRDPKQGRSEFR